MLTVAAKVLLFLAGLVVTNGYTPSSGVKCSRSRNPANNLGRRDSYMESRQYPWLKDGYEGIDDTPYTNEDDIIERTMEDFYDQPVYEEVRNDPFLNELERRAKELKVQEAKQKEATSTKTPDTTSNRE